MIPRSSPAKSSLRYSGLAIECCACLFLPVYAGYWADSYWSISSHLFAWVGIFVAIVLVFSLLYLRLIKK